ncbi:MAG: hypothetical protein AMXMBFR7_05220 [Planctomycetota bacterium]
MKPHSMPWGIGNSIQALALLALLLGGVSAPWAAGQEPAAEEMEPPPEGFEERAYSLRRLLNAPINQRESASGTDMNLPRLLPEDIIGIVTTCAAPDTWRRHGPARIESDGQKLIVLQAKEVHAEIEKVLAWLEEGAAPEFRATVVVAALAPADIAAWSQVRGGIAPADLLKALGAHGTLGILDLRGQEGQRLWAQAGGSRTYIGDYDVSGAVLDPVVRLAPTGLEVTAKGLRMPDTETLLSLEVVLCKTPDFLQANMDFDSRTDVLAKAIEKPKKDPGPDEEGVQRDEEKAPARRLEAVAPIEGHLSIALPRQATARMSGALKLPRGRYMLVGAMEPTSAMPELAGKKLAVFASAQIGTGEPNTLRGVGGLREGEVFALYPMDGLANSPAEFQPPRYRDFESPAAGNPFGGEAVNAFSIAPTTASVPNDTLRRARSHFIEKIRKNKLVEVRGPVLFTRLPEAEHPAMLKSLQDEAARSRRVLRLHAVAFTFPAAAYQTLILEDRATFDAPAIAKWAETAGVKCLADFRLHAVNGQRVYAVCGQDCSYISDYEISGDSYDPSIGRTLELGSILEVTPELSSSGQNATVNMKFLATPDSIEIGKDLLQTFSMQDGASSSVVLKLNAEVHHLQTVRALVHATAQVPLGNYVRAGSATLIAKPDAAAPAQQVVVFLRAEAE